MALNSRCADHSVPLWHSAFYRFTPLVDPQAVVEWLTSLAQGLLGSVLVAEEGINGMLAGPAIALDRFEHALARDPAFAGIRFKRSPCSTPPFARLKIRRKREIVTTGLAGLAMRSNPAAPSHKTPHEWRELIARPDVLLLDNRNQFEHRLGHFRNAVDPGVQRFRDFPRYVQTHAEAWKASGAQIAMYCTGGIRCEKLAPWMQSLGLTVWQLEGGVLNYFDTLPDAHLDWQGECFVFDNRITLDTKLEEPSAYNPR
jgi:UPF0176 protein